MGPMVSGYLAPRQRIMTKPDSIAFVPYGTAQYGTCTSKRRTMYQRGHDMKYHI
jgi:hypothetical protein